MNNVHVNLYETLNVSRKASVSEIKRAYKKLAKEFHPDKNPNAGDKFKEISYAHEVLTDPQKRAIYDQYGIKGLQKGRRSSESSFTHPDDDILSFMFGMGGSRSHNHHAARRQNHDTIHPLNVSLEDLYASKPVRIFVNRNVVCHKCKGCGTKSGLRHMCYHCGGSGTQVQYAQLLFLVQQQIQCPGCRGTGYVIPEADCCINCRGKQVCVEKKGLDFWIEKGLKHDHKIILRGKGDQAPNMEPGNIVVILQEQPHDVFKRKGDHLFVEKEISLTEALCGFSFALTHLDGRVLRITRSPGSCIQPDQVKGVYSEGMPIVNSTDKGNLYIKFKVKFPENYFANENQIKGIEDILGPRTPFTMPVGEDTEEVDLHEFDGSQQRSHSRHHEAYSEDEEEGYSDYSDHFGRGIPCATQ